MSEKIIEILKNKNKTLSFEVFPPHKNQDKDLSIIFNTIDKLKQQNPDFISVTYGTGGKNKERALKIAEFLNENNIVPLSHLTCLGYTKIDIDEIIDELYKTGVRNIMALRGDIPETFDEQDYNSNEHYKLAKDLIRHLNKDNRFCIGGAVYPEGHQQCLDINKNVEYTKIKSELGADFFVTQLFYKNTNFYRFVEKLEKSNVDNPVIPGIMPVLRANQINRIIEISGCEVPESLQKIINKYGQNDSDMEKAGIEFAVNQINDLYNHGINNIHLYTMNKSEQSLKIAEQIL